MTREEVQRLLERMETWPPAKQLMFYHLLEWLDGRCEAPELTPEQDAELDEALAAAERGEFASEDEMKSVFDKYR
jgi:hypothetical protein